MKVFAVTDGSVTKLFSSEDEAVKKGKVSEVVTPIYYLTEKGTCVYLTEMYMELRGIFFDKQEALDTGSKMARDLGIESEWSIDEWGREFLVGKTFTHKITWEIKEL